MGGLGSHLPDLRNRRSVAARARSLCEVDKSRMWKDEGFRSLAEWSEALLGDKRRYTFMVLLIGKHLLDPSLVSDEDVNRFGVMTSWLLARLAKQGKLDAQWLERARNENTKQRFKELVESLVGRGSGKRDVGELLKPSFRGLVYAPTTEQGVVYVFGMVAYELGFLVEAMQGRYPACIARQKVPGKKERWREVRIEFEYLSSNFRHAPEGADLIVCWEDDLKSRGKRAPLPVLELKSAIDRLRGEVNGC
jgi:hypothetical protein